MMMHADDEEISEGEDMDNLSNDDESGDGDGMENSSGSEDYLDDSEEDNDDDEVEDEIVDKFLCNFSNGDYDAEFDNALCADRGAVLPNTHPTRASYDKPNNWVERNRIGLEKMKRELQGCIAKVSPGYSRMGIYLNHNSGGYYHYTLMDNEEPIVWHEPILDEYWGINLKKQFSGTLPQIFKRFLLTM